MYGSWRSGNSGSISFCNISNCSTMLYYLCAERYFGNCCALVDILVTKRLFKVLMISREVLLFNFNVVLLLKTILKLI